MHEDTDLVNHSFHLKYHPQKLHKPSTFPSIPLSPPPPFLQSILSYLSQLVHQFPDWSLAPSATMQISHLSTILIMGITAVMASPVPIADLSAIPSNEGLHKRCCSQTEYALCLFAGALNPACRNRPDCDFTQQCCKFARPLMICLSW